MANALFNQDKINDLFRQKLQQAVNDLLESELTAFLGYNPYEREAVYIAIGIKPNGHKEVIDYWIAPTENIEIWSEMLKGFKSRGLEQVEIFLSDGVVGMKEAICQSYPKAHFQRCLVHVMRNISVKMRVDDRQKVLDEFKQIHTQSNKEMAVQVLHEFYQNWEKAYKNVVKDLRQVEPGGILV